MTILQLLNKPSVALMATEYGLDEKRLRFFWEDLVDFLVAEAGKEGPSVAEVSKKFGVSQKAIRTMQRKGMLGTPLKQSDLEFLERLVIGWGHVWLVRQMSASMPKQRRIQAISAPQFTAAWERYVYGRYIRWVQGDKKIKTRHIANEVKERFCKLIITESFLLLRIDEIRKQAKKDKAYAKSKNIKLSEYEKKRCNKDNDVNLIT